MLELIDGCYVIRAGYMRGLSFPVETIVSDLLAAGWRSGQGRDNWLRWIVLKAEGGDVERTARQISRELRLPESPAIGRVAAVMVAFTARTGALSDSDIGSLQSLLVMQALYRPGFRLSEDELQYVV